MSSLMTEPSASELERVPLLTHRLANGEFPAALGLALEARLAEKQALLDLSLELVQNIRPELDRLTAELVQRTLQGLWEKRCENYQNTRQ